MPRYKIEINKAWCKECGICVDFCPKKVLSFDEKGKATVLNLDACVGCGMCEYRCPDYAIKVEGCENGKAAS